MRSLFLVILFAFVLNIDNLVLAGVYRLKRVRISAGANAVIAALSGVATGGGVLLARLGQSESAQLGFKSSTEIIGRSLLLMIGIWTLVGYCRAWLFPSLASPRLAGRETGGEGERVMTASASLVPATALAVDNLAPSFAFVLLYAGRSGLVAAGVMLTVLATAFSVAAVWLGQSAGQYGGRSLRWIPPELVSGCLIIVVALYSPGDFFQDWFFQHWFGR